MIGPSSRRLEALALFGSAARRDNDALSDLDLLVVAGNSTTLREVAPCLDTAGWSCTAYTWMRMERCVAEGSLFGIHLRNEAIILGDSQGRLGDLLRSCEPRPAGYAMEFRDACLLISELSRIPDHELGRIWALDVLAVGFRSAAVALLADEGLYVFSFPRILAQLRALGRVSRSEARALHALRGFKAAYRSDLAGAVPKFDDVRRLIDIVSRGLGLGLYVRSQSDDEVMQRVLDQTGIGSHWYRDSRLVELATQRLRPRGHDRVEFAAEKRALLKILRNPTQYGGFLKSCWPTVRERLASLYSYSAA